MKFSGSSQDHCTLAKVSSPNVTENVHLHHTYQLSYKTAFGYDVLKQQ